MCSLALASRELAALMQPLLWQAVVLDKSFEWLVYFIDDVVPRHGHHIRSIVVLQPDEVQSFFDVRTPLLALAIESLPNLATVLYLSKGLPGKTDTYDGLITSGLFDDFVRRSPSEDWIPLALAALGYRLNELTLQGIGVDKKLDEGGVASFLSHFPLLSRLLVLSVINAELTMPGHLISTLATLRHLRHLSLRLINFDTEAFANAAWECPLEILWLRVNPSLSARAFTTLLSHFSSTLTALCLNSYSKDREDPVLSTSYTTSAPLPRLHTLLLGSNFPSAVLANLSPSPLRYLTIDGCPLISCTAWTAFVASHAPTLRRVIVSRSAAKSLSSKNINSLRRLCETHGIEFLSRTLPAEDEDRESDTASENRSEEDEEEDGEDDQ